MTSDPQNSDKKGFETDVFVRGKTCEDRNSMSMLIHDSVGLRISDKACRQSGVLVRNPYNSASISDKFFLRDEVLSDWQIGRPAGRQNGFKIKK